MTTTLDPSDVHWRDDAKVIGLVGLAHAGSHFSHLLLPLMFPVFIQSFGLSYAELGLLMSVFFAVSGFGQASAGFLVDRVGARPVLFVAMGIFVAACLTASMANSYAALMGVAILLGLGNSTFHPVDFTILNQKVSDARIGYAFSAHALTGNLGWAVAPLFMVGLASVFDWRVAYMGAALMFALILLLLVWQRENLVYQVVVHASDTPKVHSMAFLKDAVVWWCFIFFMLTAMTLVIVQSFSVSILQAMHGVSFNAATMTLTAYMLCAAAGVAVGGIFAARIPQHSERVVAVCMTVAAALMALCGSGWLEGTATMVVLAITGLAIGLGGPARDMMIKNATPKGATGRVYGMVYSGIDVGSAVSPLMFGVFMDRGWFGATLIGAAIVLMLSVWVALRVGHRYANA
jgi:MFS family permease